MRQGVWSSQYRFDHDYSLVLLLSSADEESALLLPLPPMLTCSNNALDLNSPIVNRLVLR